MVIVRLTGGIGNQMFQYAAARRIALVNRSPLFIDLGWFEEYGAKTGRKYELDAFFIEAKPLAPEVVKKWRSWRQNPLLRHLPNFLKKIILNARQAYILEKSYDFDPDILKLPGSVYLDGYWQSEKYFSDIEPVIRLDFSFRNEPSEANRRTMAQINACQSVAIHIRRGDYVTLPETNAYHGLCSLSYYQSAVDQISRKVEKPVFFVFSDDIDWARANLNLGFETHFMDHNGPERGADDLRLMSACRHHIIANSSFSWWGAWLSSNPEKIVYAPKKWFNRDIETPDNLPASWLKL